MTGVKLEKHLGSIHIRLKSYQMYLTVFIGCFVLLVF